ncbi:hypothetical protein QQF64_011808 [Cirrhinus molitorella]|uniref:Uncharacterized protein n=1 Tax=Cirrhinus molitorella TaxID=172907 RepID=A0ABR3LXV7_9TELE
MNIKHLMIGITGGGKTGLACYVTLRNLLNSTLERSKTSWSNWHSQTILQPWPTQAQRYTGGGWSSMTRCLWGRWKEEGPDGCRDQAVEDPPSTQT